MLRKSRQFTRHVYNEPGCAEPDGPGTSAEGTELDCSSKELRHLVTKKKE